MENPNPEKPKSGISRRGFLKAGLVGTAALLVGKEASKLQAEQLKIETDSAIYYPFYEGHRKPITLEELKLYPAADIHFVELTVPSRIYTAKDFDASAELFTQAGNYSRTDPNTLINVTRLLPDDILNYFAENNTAVVFEGMDFPDKMRKLLLPLHDIEAGMGIISLGLSRILASSLPKDSAAPNQIITAGNLIAAWGFSGNLSNTLHTLTQELLPRSYSRLSLARLSQKLGALQANAHPEDLMVFMRNIFMARKFEFLAEQLPTLRQLDRKPKISYNVGAAHAGIEDLLHLGPNLTISLLNIYPKELLINIVEYNGGLDSFCSSVVIPVRENVITKNDAKTTLLDEKLRDYLFRRLQA